MILSRHLQELLRFKTPGAGILSLYLDVDAGKSAMSAFQALCQGLGRARAEELQADLQRVGQALVESRSQSARGLAVFSSGRFGLLRVWALPEPVKNRLTIDDKPYLAPLLNLADQHQRYGVALIGERRARFLEAFMGRVHELDECLRPEDVPGGRTAYLTAIATKLDALRRDQGFQRVIVGATAEVSPTLTELLPRALQDNLILDPALAPETPAEEVRARITEAEAQARRVRELVLVHRVLDGDAEAAALGLRPTLAALEQGRLKTLLMRDGFAKLGRRCHACRRLSLSDPKCASCGAGTETLFNLADEIAERVLEQGGEVFRLQNVTPLDNLGHVGAQLRRTAAATAAPRAMRPAEPARDRAGTRYRAP